jgi:hypothetical protein
VRRRESDDVHPAEHHRASPKFGGRAAGRFAVGGNARLFGKF